MNKPYIKAKDMLEAMRETKASGEGVPFVVGFLTADRRRRTGGQYRVMKATLSQGGKRSGSVAQRVINLVPFGTHDVQPVHFDNILFFNDHPVS
ncbi:hypothetical protein GCM10027275_24900 [Rhabdobacter roseus]|uniref:Uncharacterized protein n=1 Tax=Rhabdobacter roseus TaxID=1655419 RepID=A0A840TWW1_9BACT|nr:hypothetical protein [Rhabdobacter roseus]MBB5284430.1 hypothetical protein [Rhabdobacter roseus]